MEACSIVVVVAFPNRLESLIHDTNKFLLCRLVGYDSAENADHGDDLEI